MENLLCVLCTAEYRKTVLLSCLHSYHKRCFKKWIKKRKFCPLCRYQRGFFNKQTIYFFFFQGRSAATKGERLDDFNIFYLRKFFFIPMIVYHTKHSCFVTTIFVWTFWIIQSFEVCSYYLYIKISWATFMKAVFLTITSYIRTSI